MSERTQRAEGVAVALGLVAVLAAVTAVRLRLLDFPLERDEGEYAYVGRLLLSGEPPYRLAYTMKLPGTHAMYALFLAAFGQSVGALRVGLLLVNLASIALVFRLGCRWIGAAGGLAAAATFAALSTSSTTLGLVGHATHFVVLFALAGLVVVRDGAGPVRLVAGGSLFGAALLMKQAGLAYVLLALALPHLGRDGSSRSPWRASALLAVGAALPLGATLGALAAAGVLDEFWLWAVSYAVEYATLPPAPVALGNLRAALSNALAPAWPLWVLAAVGLGVGPRSRRALLVALSVAAVLAVLPGLQFRRHYFLLALPAVGLLSGAAVTALAQRTAGAVAALVFLAALAVTAYLDRDLIYRATPAELCRKIYGPNPFPEAERIAGFIEVRSKPDDRIAVFGSEPEILFLARRASATGYLYTYPLMEPQRRAPDMQREMVTEVEAARPAFLVYVNVPSSWLVRPESDTAILDWMRGFCERQYRLVGAVEIVSAETTRFLWNESAASFQPETPNYVLIYERRE